MKNWIIILLSILAFQACVDQQFDEPPFGEVLAEAPEVTNTIAELKALHVSGTYAKIEQDIVVRAVIAADDKTGNLFRRLVVQDESGGIELNINGVELHNSFPEGREIYIKCKDLWMGDFAGVIGLGGAQGTTSGGDPRLDGIEEVLLDQFIVKGATGNDIAPKVKTIAQLGADDISTLVQIDNLEFEAGEAGNTYADFQQNTNRYLQDCNGASILIRTSGYSDFYNETLPSGQGTLVAIYNVFNDTKQLLVRRPAEVALNGPRCDGSGGGGGGVEPMELPDATTTIADLKSSHTFGNYTSIPDGQIIKGIVTADDASGNFFKKIIVQDGSAGIELLVNERDLAANFGLQIGREIAINCDGLLLGDFEGNISIGGETFTNNSGNLQLGGIAPENINAAILVGEPNMALSPTAKSINDLSENDIHSLVVLSGIQFNSASANVTYADVVNNFSQNLDLEDCDGNNIIIRSSSFADFAGAITPNGNGTITAIYSVFGGDKQLFIRDLGDINMSGTRCDGSGGGGGEPGEEIFNVNFEGLTSNDVLDVQGWTNFAEAGSLNNNWIVRDFSDNTYAQISAFESTDSNNIGWFISPSFEASNTSTLSFMMGQCHWQHEGMSVLISDNFSGDPTNATWQSINCTLPTVDDDFWAFVSSGTINIADYFSSGSVNIAFKYTGSVNSAETTYILDDIIATK